MTPLDWMICLPTIPTRAASRARLLAALLPQLEPYAGRVRVLGWLNVGTPRLAEIRDRMMLRADMYGAGYVSFIDDDDVVPPYFVAEVMAALEQEPVHVGFLIEYWKDGTLRSIVEHSFRHDRWWHRRKPAQNGRGELEIFRDFTHIDPMRIDVARSGRFAAARPHQMEDRSWCRQVRGVLHARDDLRTEVYIDKIMYQYFWVPDLSAWDDPRKTRALAAETAVRPKIDSPYFIWHEESL